MKLIIRLIIATLAVWVASQIIPGVSISDIKTALLFAIILGVLNAIIKPILSIIAFPITLLTFGLFSLVINGAVIMLAASLVEGVVVASLLSAILFAVVMSFVSWFLNLIAG